MGEALPAEDHIASWWRLVGALQGLLLGSVIVGLAWIAVIIAFGGAAFADRGPEVVVFDGDDPAVRLIEGEIVAPEPGLM